MSYYNYGGDNGGGDWERGSALAPTGWGGPRRGDWGPPQNMWGGGWGGGNCGWGGGGYGQPPPQPPAAAAGWWMGGYHGGYSGGFGPPPHSRGGEQNPSEAGIEVGGGSMTPGTNDHRVHENALKDLNQVDGRLKIGVGCVAGQKNIAHIGAFRGADEEPRPQPQTRLIPPGEPRPQPQTRLIPPGYGIGIGVNFRGY